MLQTGFHSDITVFKPRKPSSFYTVKLQRLKVSLEQILPSAKGIEEMGQTDMVTRYWNGETDRSIDHTCGLNSGVL